MTDRLWYSVSLTISCKWRFRMQWLRVFVLVSLMSPLATAKEPEWRPLLNESLSGWEVFTGVPHASTKVPGFPPSESKDCRTGTAVGLADPLQNFSIVQVDGEPMLKVRGQGYAGLSSKAEFENYHLSLEYKWGQKKYPPREQQKRDSGVLIHCTGEHGAFWNVWLRSLECQIQETDTGDFIALAGVSAKSHVQDVESKRPQYKPDGKFIPVGSGSKAWGMQRQQNHELVDAWNRVDVMAVGDRVLFAVNGHVVMRLDDCKIGKQSDGVPLTKGRIQLQSEAAEIAYRRIRIRELKTLPTGMLLTPSP